MVRFDEVLQTLVRVVEMSPVVEAIDGAGVVRDLRGQVRLFLKPKEGSVLDKGPLEDALEQELRQYFVPPIWVIGARGEEGRLASKMYSDYCKPWRPEEIHDPLTGRRWAARDIWRKHERRLSKQMWLDEGQPEPPWSPASDEPAIITFYSFKGGVGRTTALISCAWQLARDGKQVAIIDLDLEAPGLAALLTEQPGPGVIDFIVDWLATGQGDLEGLYRPALALGADSSRVQVIPAGNLGAGYLEKLARLDFLAAGLGDRESPVEKALAILLKRVANQLPSRPDYILLDSRAGLHDLAGLSLHGLAHIDVILGRASQQGYEGLELTLQTLGRRRREENLRPVIVHSLAPRENLPTAKDEEARFRSESYRIFKQHIYRRDTPVEEDNAAPHYPIVLRQDERLERFVSIKGTTEVAEALFSRPYRALYERIMTLSQWKS